MSAIPAWADPEISASGSFASKGFFSHQSTCISQRVGVRNFLEKKTGPLGSNCFSRGIRSSFFFVRKHITTCDFPVGGREVQTPCPSSGSAHVLVIMTCFQISSRSYSIDFSIYIFAINLITLNKFNEDASGAIQKNSQKIIFRRVSWK